MAFLLGLDIGTTNTKAVVYNTALGKIVEIITQPTPIKYPKLGWREHDPEELWNTVKKCISHCAKNYAISGLSISSMAEAGLPLGSNGEPLYPIIAWHDQRCMQEVGWLENQIDMSEMHKITGQRINPSFSANKILWLKNNNPDIFNGIWKWLSVPDYVFYKLTGEIVTDYSIASRTLLFDQQSLSWSEKILDNITLNKKNLPETLSGGSFIGVVKGKVASSIGLKPDTKCVLGGHDHLCATIAAGNVNVGDVCDSSGSSEAVLTVVNQFHTSSYMAQHGYACYAHVIGGYYVIKAGMKSSGSAIDWLIRNILFETKYDDEFVNQKLHLAEKSIGQRIGPLWLPHWLGGGSPDSDRFSRAALIGIRLEHQPEDILRGMFESLAFWLKQNICELEKMTGINMSAPVLLGGTTKYELLSRIKANVLGVPVHVPKLEETAALGAALIAGIGSGEFNDIDEAIASVKCEFVNYEPETELNNFYDNIYESIYCDLYRSLEYINQKISMFTIENKLNY